MYIAALCAVNPSNYHSQKLYCRDYDRLSDIIYCGFTARGRVYKCKNYLYFVDLSTRACMNLAAEREDQTIERT